MLRTSLRSLALVAIALQAAGCATITQGTNDVLQFQSSPQGAAVQTSNGMSCASTPCSIKMPRKSELVATFSKPGCKSRQVSVTNKMAGGGGAAVAGNVLEAGIIGLGIDAATGAGLELVPNPVVVELTC